MMDNVNYLIGRMMTARQEFLNSRLKPLNLTSSLFACLVEIIQNGPLTQKELSTLLRVDPALTTRNIRKLTALGYVEKEEKQADRRCNTIRLSKDGETISKEIMMLNLEWFKIVSRDIPLDELERTLNTVKKVIINVETQILGESRIPRTPVRLPDEESLK
ncbi:MAG: MarR family winged helix-turn-helix transcriptional regulator [Spirochaetales bacterium]|nr:MarR family winged helix-turn-helix transcriptional regulator [Spirochaetales bacterium]